MITSRYRGITFTSAYKEFITKLFNENIIFINDPDI